MRGEVHAPVGRGWLRQLRARMRKQIAPARIDCGITRGARQRLAQLRAAGNADILADQPMGLAVNLEAVATRGGIDVQRDRQQGFLAVAVVDDVAKACDMRVGPLQLAGAEAGG